METFRSDVEKSFFYMRCVSVGKVPRTLWNADGSIKIIWYGLRGSATMVITHLGAALHYDVYGTDFIVEDCIPEKLPEIMMKIANTEAHNLFGDEGMNP